MKDDQEHPRDPALNRLLRQTPQVEPPNRLDAIILAAARDELVPRRRPRSWWQRVQAPLALAATVTLAIGLSLTLDRAPPNTELPSQTAAPESKEKAPLTPQPAAADALPTARPAAKAPEPVSPPSPARQAGSPEARQEGGRPAAPPAPSAAAQTSSVAASGEKGATTAANTTGAPGTTVAAEAAPAAAELRRSQAAPAAKAIADAKREERSEAMPQRSPESWLDDIRRLRRQGNHDEAARQLTEFRRAYPDHPIPEDFR